MTAEIPSHLCRLRILYPPSDPTTNIVLFSLARTARCRRTAAGFASDARRVALAREQGAFQSAVGELVKNCGARAYSLLSCPRPADKQRIPHTKYLSAMGPSFVPYDTMHLIPANVVNSLWQLSTKIWTVPGDPLEEYHLTSADADLIGREIRGARGTVPESQARSLRDVRVHWKSYKDVDWLYFILSLVEAELTDRIPDIYYEMVMSLVKSCRLMFQPTALSRADVAAIKTGLEEFCESFYDDVYRHDPTRPTKCRLTIAALLDVISGISSRGPV